MAGGVPLAQKGHPVLTLTHTWPCEAVSSVALAFVAALGEIVAAVLSAGGFLRCRFWATDADGFGLATVV